MPLRVFFLNVYQHHFFLLRTSPQISFLRYSARKIQQHFNTEGKFQILFTVAGVNPGLNIGSYPVLLASGGVLNILPFG